MFKAYFGLTQAPFRKDLPNSMLFPSKGYLDLITRLRYSIDQAEIDMVSGDVGAGKSTAIRAVCASLPSSRYRVLYVANPTLSVRDLYRDLLREMEMEPPWTTADARRQFREALVSERDEQGRIPVLIIDDAHNLRPEVLEELRMLHNFDMDARTVFCLILVGHTELGRMLTRRSAEALNQRIHLRYHLTGMEWDETRQYLRHHLELAGASEPLFTESATRQIFLLTQGLPRKINSLALHALEQAFLGRNQLVDQEDVTRSAVDFPA